MGSGDRAQPYRMALAAVMDSDEVRYYEEGAPRVGSGS